jgi:cell division septal protein FtsQ
MRDYKNVRVPRSYRNETKRTSLKRVRAGRPYQRQRKSSGGLKNMFLNAVVALMIGTSAFLAWQGYRTVMHADLFVVSGVDVKGIKQLGERDLKEIVAAFTGQNIFRVDLDAAAKRARENPWVQEVRIHRRLPNRITMVFTERVPSLILETAGGRYLMDNEGVVIEKLGKDGSASWPLPVVAIRAVHAHPGEEVTAEALPEAMHLIDEVAARGGWEPAEVTVKADTPDSIALLYGGYLFKIGSGRYGEKLRRLGEIMTDVKNRGLDIRYVDLRPERQAAAMVDTSGGRGRAGVR